MAGWLFARQHLVGRRGILAALTVALLVAPALLRAQEAVSGGPRIALIIANWDYVNPRQRLSQPSRDADTMRAALRERGFHGVDDADSPTVVSNATNRQLRDAIVGFRDRLAKAGPLAVGFIYYAGHGVADEERTDSYMLPVDTADVDAPNAPATGTTVRWVTSLLSQIPEARRPRLILVVDACRSRAGSEGVSGRGLPKPDSMQPKSMLVALSTVDGAPANDDGLYARTLAAKMSSAAMTVSELFEQVKIDVSNKTSGKQIPMHESQILSDLCFVTCRGDSGMGAEQRLRNAQATLMDVSKSRERGELGQTAALEVLIGAGRTFESSQLFMGLSVKNGKLPGMQAAKARMQLSDWSSSDLRKANWNGVSLTGALLVDVHLEDAELVEARAPLVVASAAHFERAKAQRSVWAGSDLRKASFAAADLRGSSFQLADLREADFAGADLTNVTFSGADLRGAVFAGAKTDNTNFYGTLKDRGTLSSRQLASGCEDRRFAYLGLDLTEDDPSRMPHYWDYEYLGASASWQKADWKGVECKLLAVDQVPSNFDKRGEESQNMMYASYRIVLPADLLENGGRRSDFTQQARKLFFRAIAERAEAAHSMGLDVGCPFGYGGAGACDDMKKRGVITRAQ